MLDNISELAAKLSSNHWVTLTSWLFGLLGLISLIKRHPRRRPFFALEERVIIPHRSKIHGDLAISFRGASVDSLALTTIFFWNGGKEPIRKSDVAPNDPVLLSIPEGMQVLHYEVTEVASISCGVALGRGNSDSEILIEFDHMDFRQGAGIAILHTLDPQPITVRGTIIGADPIIRRHSNPTISVGRFPFWVTVTSIITLLPMYWPFAQEPHHRYAITASYVGIWLIAVLFASGLVTAQQYSPVRMAKQRNRGLASLLWSLGARPPT